MIFILYYLLHMKMKKLLLGAFLWIFTLAGVALLPNYVSADIDDQDSSSNNGWDYGGFDGNWGWLDQNRDYNPDVAWKDDLQEDSLIHTIKVAINWVLGILSLIALALCLWGGFQMMTSGGDQKKYESGLNILKWAGIGLAVIAVSWLIVSLIFYVINWSIQTSSNTTTTPSTTNW